MAAQEKNQAGVNPLNEFLTEQEVLDLLALSKGQLDRLRKKGFPFCGISNTLRMYLVADIVDFIKTKRRVLSDDVGGDTDDETTDGKFLDAEAHESMLEDDESSWKEPEEG
uniref:Uncharacterized protein n=1 Tax=viral metagenome TaxID=1070528 RepID=A0A6M3JRU5_9ZZZZ